MAGDSRLVGEELKRLADRQIENFGDVLAFETNFERVAVVASTLAYFARHVDIGQELHFNSNGAVSRARFAAPARDVKREAARLVAANFCIGRVGEQFANLVEHAGVRSRVRAGCATDRRLIHVDDLVQLVDAGH